MDKWIPSRIITRLGNLYYEMEDASKRFKRHLNQIRAFTKKESECSPMDINPSFKQEQSSSPRRVHFYGDRFKIISDKASSTTPRQ